MHLLRTAWLAEEASVAQGHRSRGLIANLWKSLQHFGWHAAHLDAWTTEAGEEIQVTQIPKGKLQHDLRRAAQQRA
eukprot:4377462-Amphidinium_carterae.1